eukprot:TRINITY_DN2019_c0_g1_i2.p1 TRINITY_DN2019_c0_g1~~TRINITY_DN2019_c0_g1_i2.p1  ORF type:complete len:227 (-),score=27.57 TRINITY_DN2019_c0_g1_i2:73-729(-)
MAEVNTSFAGEGHPLAIAHLWERHIFPHFDPLLLLQQFSSVSKFWALQLPLLVTSLSLDHPLEESGSVLLPFTNLTSLTLLNDVVISDDVLSSLSGLLCLELGLKGYELISDAGISPLSNLTSLAIRDVSLVTDAGILPLTNLTSLYLEGNDLISDDGVSSLTNLATLKLEFDELITDAGISSLSGLTSLKLEGNQFVTDVGLSPLTKLTRLGLQDHH